MGEIQKILVEIGMSKQEITTYQTLLELGEAQTGLLSKESGIATSNIYPVLENLQAKGLVSFRMQNNIKVFMPAPPEALNELFLTKQKDLETKRKEVTKAIEQLKKREIHEKSQTNYKYYEGLIGIKAMWHEITKSLKNLKKGTTTKYYTGIMESYTPLVAFYDEFHQTRIKKRIENQIIFPIEDKETAQRRKRQKSEVRFMKLENEAEWGVIGDLYFIQYITAKKPCGFLIKDKKIANSFEQVFDQLWEFASK